MINDTEIRLAVFVVVLLVMVVWESSLPNRVSPVTKAKRWFSNYAMLLLGALLARVFVPTGLAAVAILAHQHNIGLWNHLSVPFWLTVPATIVFFDCLIYWQHRLFHRIDIFWRFHKVHHADPHLDTSTGLRFHPFEIVFSLVIKALAVLLLGAPVAAVLIFEIVLNATSIFNHANIKLPDWIETPLRKIVVTQAMHRIHHSQNVAETDSNFGFNLSMWDRIFNTYTSNAANGDKNIQLGLKEYAKPQTNSQLIALLLMPFKKQK